MIKVLVVDDEPPIKEWLENMIKSAGDEYSLIAGPAFNGAVALEICEKEMPDIVLTDIIMPVMDGVELVKILRSKYEDVKIIVLSNYSDFKYVRETLYNGASDYLLKLEVKPYEMKKILDKVNEDIRVKIEKKNELNTLKSSLNSSIYLMKEKFVREILGSNNTNPEYIKKQAVNLDFGSEDTVIGVLNIHPVKPADIPENSLYKDEELFRFSFINLCDESINNITKGFTTLYNNKYVAIAGLDGARSARSILEDISTAIIRNSKEFLGVTAAIGISNVSNGFYSIRTRFEQSLSALDCTFFTGAESYVFYEDMTINSEAVKAIKCCRTVILDAFKEERYDKAVAEMSKMTRMLHLWKGYSTKEFRDIIKAVLFGIEDYIENLSLNDVNINTGSGIFGKVEEAEYLDQIVEALESYISDIERCLNKKAVRYSQPVKNAIDYIRNNYSFRINRTIVAEYVHLNESYFSELFKKETNYSFSDYLISVRIDAAKELLKKTDLPVLSISEQVGYFNQSYFTKLFKNITGLTPFQYREQHAR